MAEESELVEDLVASLTSAIREFRIGSEQDKRRTNPNHRRLLETTRDLTDRFRQAATEELKRCPRKPPKNDPVSSEVCNEALVG